MFGVLTIKGTVGKYANGQGRLDGFRVLKNKSIVANWTRSNRLLIYVFALVFFNRRIVIYVISDANFVFSGRISRIRGVHLVELFSFVLP